MKLQLAFGAIASLILSDLAQAVVLQGIQGNVRISRGDGYVVAADGSELSPGDMVMADLKATALLVYPDGCHMRVKAGSVAVVGDKSPCSQMTAQFPASDQGTASQRLEAGSDIAAVMAVGGAVGAGAAGASAAASSGNNTKPSSLPLLLSIPVSP
jgi:hypothetical protein